MDKNERNQLCFIIGGLVSLVLGLYLFTLQVERIIASLFTVSGIVFLISGIRYKERLNRKVLKGDERAAYTRSSYFITVMTGTVIFLAGLGGAALTMYLNVPSADRIWILGVIFLGGLLIVIGSFLKKETYGT